MASEPVCEHIRVAVKQWSSTTGRTLYRALCESCREYTPFYPSRAEAVAALEGRWEER